MPDVSGPNQDMRLHYQTSRSVEKMTVIMDFLQILFYDSEKTQNSFKVENKDVFILYMISGKD